MIMMMMFIIIIKFIVNSYIETRLLSTVVKMNVSICVRNWSITKSQKADRGLFFLLVCI